MHFVEVLHFVKVTRFVVKQHTHTCHADTKICFQNYNICTPKIRTRLKQNSQNPMITETKYKLVNANPTVKRNPITNRIHIEQASIIDTVSRVLCVVSNVEAPRRHNRHQH